jgi:hypothetical protein
VLVDRRSTQTGQGFHVVHAKEFHGRTSVVFVQTMGSCG